MSGFVERLSRPVLAALALAVVEALLVVFGPAGPPLLLTEAMPHYLLTAVSLAAMCCLAIWALGSVIARATGTIGRTVSGDPRPERWTGLFAGLALGGVSVWAVWPALLKLIPQSGSARQAAAVVTAAVVSIGVFAIVSGVAWRSRRRRRSLGLAFLFFSAAVAILLVAAIWLRDAPHRVRGLLALVALCCACLSAASMPGTPAPWWMAVAMLAMIAVAPGLRSMTRVVKMPAARYWVERYAPTTGGILLVVQTAGPPSRTLTLANEPGTP